MNRTVFFLAMLLGLFITAPAQAASDCSGSWQTLPNYSSGGGGPCKVLGLDSNRGTCLPGQSYETLCDDMKGGKYRTCQGPQRCEGDQDRRSNRYRDDRGRDDRGRDDSCKGWDYSYDQPCPRGYINYDCQGGCEPRY